VLTQTSAEEVQFTGPTGLDTALLSRLPAARGIREERPGFYVMQTARPGDLLVELTTWGRDRGILLNDLRVGHESLEEVFLRLTGHELRE